MSFQWVPQPVGTQGGTVVSHIAGSKAFSAGEKEFLSFLSLSRLKKKLINLNRPENQMVLVNGTQFFAVTLLPDE